MRRTQDDRISAALDEMRLSWHIGAMQSATSPPLLLRQFLAWVAAEERTDGETMEAWRTSCPRLPVWEDATAEGLVALTPGAGGQAECVVALTQAGAAWLRQQT